MYRGGKSCLKKYRTVQPDAVTGRHGSRSQASSRVERLLEEIRGHSGLKVGHDRGAPTEGRGRGRERGQHGQCPSRKSEDDQRTRKLLGRVQAKGQAGETAELGPRTLCEPR